MDGDRDRLAGAVLPAGRRGSRVVRPVAVPGGGEPCQAPTHHHAGEDAHHIEHWSTARLEGPAGAVASYIQVGLQGRVCVCVFGDEYLLRMYYHFLLLFLHLLIYFSAIRSSLFHFLLHPPRNKIPLIRHQQQ